MNDINHNEGINKLSQYLVELFCRVARQYGLSDVEQVSNGLVCVPDEQSTELNLGLINLRILNGGVYEKVLFSFKSFDLINNYIEHFIVKSIGELFLGDKHEVIQCSEFFQNEPSFIKLVEKVKQSTDELINKNLDEFCGRGLDLVKSLSTSKYEKSTCYGNIAFLASNENVEYISLFRYDEDEQIIYFKNDNKKIIRKLLEIATGEIALGLEKVPNENLYYLKGFVKRNDCSRKISFDGLSRIRYYDKNEPIVNYIDGNYCKEAIEMFTLDDKLEIEQYFTVDGTKNTDAIKVFEKYSNEVYEDEQFHGAIIIMTDDNLFIEHMIGCGRGFVPDHNTLNLFDIYKLPKNLKQTLLIKFSCIDGAVIFDSNGELKMYGAILDGVAIGRAQMESGSRFNSVKTFVEHYSFYSSESKYLAIVMSENGPVKVFRK